MKRYAVLISISCLFFIFVPYLSTLGMAPTVINLSEYKVTILQTDGTKTEMNMEEYICNSIIAISDKRYNDELIKALAVCEYSYLAYSHQNLKTEHQNADVCADEKHCRPTISTAQAMAKHGTEYYETVKECIRQTSGETISYGGSAIAPVYFISGSSAYQECTYIAAPDKSGQSEYRTEIEYMSGILKFMIENSGLFDDSVLSDNPEEWITGIEYSETGRVLSASVGGVRCDSEKISLVLGLNSKDFAFSIKDDIFTFITFGYADTVGLDLAEANIKAESDDYTQILNYYFPGAEISAYRWQ